MDTITASIFYASLLRLSFCRILKGIAHIYKKWIRRKRRIRFLTGGKFRLL